MRKNAVFLMKSFGAHPHSICLTACLFPKSIVLFATEPLRTWLSPHLPAPQEQISQCCRALEQKKSQKESKEIIRLSNENGFCHKRVASLLCAATALKQNMSEIYKTSLKNKKLHELTGDILLQFEPVSDKKGKIENRFLSGVTPKGLITFTNTVKNLADDITVIRDESGITEKLLADIADYSASIGYDAIVCRDVNCLPKRPRTF